MGRAAALTRRQWLSRGGALAALPLAACRPATPPSAFDGGWLGTAQARGHRLRQAPPDLTPAVTRRVGVLVLGGGIAGLAAARALTRQGVDDFALLELEDVAGGNSRGHRMGGAACPLGAHYLPLPGPAAREVSEWLHELGLLRQELGRTVADERHLCHSPQERLFIDGAWHDGLLPPAEPGSATLAQYRRFAQRVAAVQREAAFALPTRRAPWGAALAALDGETFATWLAREGVTDSRLLWYLDYACRDDYGAGLDTVSAWAGLHYFASRHGFHAPGDGAGERDTVFTWPEGNAWLVRRLATPLGERVHTGRTILRVTEDRHGVTALAWNEATGAVEAWQARAAVVALPLFVAARVLATPPAGLVDVARTQRHAPWLVANLALREPLMDRGIGAPFSWDNVRYQGDDPGGPNGALGYVDAGHQGLAQRTGPTLITAYWAWPEAQRAALRDAAWQPVAQQVVDELTLTHPELPGRIARIDLTRYGHAMTVPVPGLRRSAALAALAEARGRIAFAHADLAGYSVFEEAFTAGDTAASRLTPLR